MPQTPNKGKQPDSTGAFASLIKELQLAWQLLRDERVPTSIKVLPVAVVVGYFLFPIDVIPDFLLGPGQLDDLAVLLLGLALFRALVPEQIVREYVKGHDNVQRGATKAENRHADYVDAEYRVLRDDE